MTTEQEFLGNEPRNENAPLAKNWAIALQDAAALFERALRAADSGETLEALAAGAEAVGMAAVAVDMKRGEYVEIDILPDTSRCEAAIEEVIHAEKALEAQRAQPLTEEDIQRAMNADLRLSRWDVLDGVGVRPVPGQVDALDELGRSTR